MSFGDMTPGPWMEGPRGRVQTVPNAAGGCEIILEDALFGRPGNKRAMIAAWRLVQALETIAKVDPHDANYAEKVFAEACDALVTAGRPRPAQPGSRPPTAPRARGRRRTHRG